MGRRGGHPLFSRYLAEEVAAGFYETLCRRLGQRWSEHKWPNNEAILADKAPARQAGALRLRAGLPLGGSGLGVGPPDVVRLSAIVADVRPG